MSLEMEKASHIPATDISRLVVDAAFHIHKEIGVGILENAYEECLALLMTKRGIPFKRQLVMPLYFENQKIDIGYRLDFLIADSLILEIKSVEKLLPVHEAQILTYMKLSKISQGLLINFNSKMFKDGIKRFCDGCLRVFRDLRGE